MIYIKNSSNGTLFNLKKMCRLRVENKINLLHLILWTLHLNYINTLEFYRAAVVEYRSLEINEYESRMLINANEYKNFMNEAKSKGVDIIVFPEYGLTSEVNISYGYSVFLPPGNRETPCFSSYYAKVIQDISCASYKHQMYTVINIIERESDSPHDTIYYNTNIVFNRQGKIVSKYRKINLSTEPDLARGHEMVTFETDFKVKFGMLICYDIIQKFPGKDLLKDITLNNFILITSWFSDMPLGVSVSVQAGYAISNNVNLLASNRNCPETATGGSGIYEGNKHPANIYISDKGTRMLIRDLPIYPKRQENSCLDIISKVSITSENRLLQKFTPDLINFQTIQQDMQNFTFKSLNRGFHTYETLCTAQNQYCCTFNISISQLSLSPGDYIYKMAIFHGVRTTYEYNLGMRACLLVACQTEDTKTCGLRLANSPGFTQFSKIKISGTFVDSDETMDQPVTLMTNLRPVDYISFCKEIVKNGRIKMTIATHAIIESILAFGIQGRLFHYDLQEAGVRNFIDY